MIAFKYITCKQGCVGISVVFDVVVRFVVVSVESMFPKHLFKLCFNDRSNRGVLNDYLLMRSSKLSMTVKQMFSDILIIDSLRNNDLIESQVI